MPPVSVIRRGQTLTPCNRASAVLVDQLPEGVPLIGDLRQRRNGKFHRLIFSIFGHVADAINAGPLGGNWTAETVAENVKLALGYAEARPATDRERALYGMPAGSSVLRPASVSYAAMDQDAFARFAIQAVDYIASELCPYLRNAPQWPIIAELLRHAGAEPMERGAA